MSLFSPQIATKISSATAFLLMVFKIIIGVLSGSVAVLASALDSFLDFLVSVMNHFTVKEAEKPADTEHPFGHGKFEAFASFIQSVVIGLSGIVLAYFGVQKILNPTGLEYELLALGVMIFSFCVTLGLFWYLRNVAEHTNSLVVKADSIHYYSDLLSNVALAGGILAIIFFDLQWVDGVLSVLMSGFILHSAYELFIESFHVLTDHEIDEEQKQKIIGILNADTKIKGWHALRTRSSGNSIFIDVHLEFSKDIELLNAHDIAFTLENKIHKEINNAEILTHFDTWKDE